MKTKLKLSKDDLRILRAALAATLEGDTDVWDELSGNDIDRAAELIEELDGALSSDDDDDDVDDDDTDPNDDDEDEDWGYSDKDDEN